MQVDSIRSVSFLFVLCLALSIGAWAWIPTNSVAQSETPQQDSFSLLDEDGTSPTDLGIDPHIDPLQVGLDPTRIVTEQNILGLAFQQSAAARQLWLIFTGVSFGVLIFWALLVRLPSGRQTSRRLLLFVILAFSLFACVHWSALEQVRAQQQILSTMLQHALEQASVPAILAPLATTLQPVTRETLAVAHLCLDLCMVGILAVLWRQYTRVSLQSISTDEKNT